MAENVFDHAGDGDDRAGAKPLPPRRMSEGRFAVLATLGIVLLGLLGIGIGYLMSGPDHPLLRKGLKEKNGIDVKTIDVRGDKGQLQLGTVTTEQGETYGIVVHTGPRNDPLRKPAEVTQWILGKQPRVAEEEIRKLVAKLGFAAASVSLQRNPDGVGYVGEVTAKTGEVIDISEKISGPPPSSAQVAELRPSSYERWIRNTLEKELKEQLVSVSEFVKKDKSWATEEAERQAPLRAAEAERQARLRADEAKRRARLQAEYDKRIKAIRQSGREPTLGEIGAARAIIGPEPPPAVDVNEIMKRMGAGQRALPQAVVTYQAATATTKGGRVIECEIELQTSPSRSINLTWREKKK